MDTSRLRRIDALNARCVVPKCVAPVGKKIISELQRRQLAGLDSRRSLDATTDSVRSSNSSQVSQSSIVLTPQGNKDEPRGSYSERFKDRVKQRQARQAEIERHLGPYDPRKIFAPPTPHLEDSADEDEDESKENFEETGDKTLLEQDSVNQSVAEQVNGSVPPDALDESVEQFAGSQGRKGQGCSTPRNVNNTLAPLRQIDVSAVSLDGSVPGARSSEKESSVEVEAMEVDEPEMVDDVFDQFRGSQKEHSSTHKDETDRKARGESSSTDREELKEKTPRVEEDTAPAINLTVTIERNPEREMAVERPQNETFPVRKDDSAAKVGETFTMETKNDNATFTIATAANDTPKELPVKTDIHDRPGPSNAEEPSLHQIQPPVVEHIDLEIAGPSKAKSPAPEKKKRPNGLDVLAHNLSNTMPSPGRDLFGFNKARPFKQSRFRTETPPRNRHSSVSAQEQKSIQMLDHSQATVDSEDSSMLDPLTEPTTAPTTPKRPSSRLGPSRPASRNSMPTTPGVAAGSFTRPHYAKPTIASKRRAIVPIEDEEPERTLSPDLHIDPNHMMIQNNIRSGYRPRLTDVSRLPINRFNDSNRSSLDDLRRINIERRINDAARISESTRINESAQVAVVEAQPELLPAGAAPDRESMEELNNSASNLAIIDEVMDGERDREQSRREVDVRHENHPEISAQGHSLEGNTIDGRGHSLRGHSQSRMEDNTVAVTLPVERSIAAPPPAPVDDSFAGGSYDDDEDEEAEVVVRRKAFLLSDSIASEAPVTPARFRHINKHRLASEDDSMVEEPASSGSVLMVMKPRQIIPAESPEEAGLRRSKRNRMAPVRAWMGEQAVYQNSPSGGVRLVGSSKVVVRDPEFIKAGTTNPVKMVERQKMGAVKKNRRRERRESSD